MQVVEDPWYAGKMLQQCANIMIPFLFVATLVSSFVKWDEKKLNCLLENDEKDET